MQRGESASEEAAARQLAILQAALTAARPSRTPPPPVPPTSRPSTTSSHDDRQKQTALQKLEQQHADESPRPRGGERTDRASARLPARRAGRPGRPPDGDRGPEYALDQIGDPYVWSEEGPNQYDCSGLMYASYRRAGGRQLPVCRGSPATITATPIQTVDRYSLLPGDLLFFRLVEQWPDIHTWRCTPARARWSRRRGPAWTLRLCRCVVAAVLGDRVYGSVDGPTEIPTWTTGEHRWRHPAPSSTPPTSKRRPAHRRPAHRDQQAAD